MAGETVKTKAICLAIHPWSQTSHIVHWLSPSGRVSSIVKGALRPKSSFLGQYDLNYTCDILYYARAHGELHFLRECVPANSRDSLRGRFRALTLAEYFRDTVHRLSPAGHLCNAWFALLENYLDVLATTASEDLLWLMICFDLEVFRLSGIAPDFSGYNPDSPTSVFSIPAGKFEESSSRILRISRETARFLANYAVKIRNNTILLDAARVISVFYCFHLDCALDVRRTVLRLISVKKEEGVYSI